MSNPSLTMEPLSARLPSDLYLWLAQLRVDGAATNSDKLRVLLGQLKRQHDGAFDYVAAHHWSRDLTGRLREALVRLEGSSGRHSEVMTLLLEHLTASWAMVVSHSPSEPAEAVKLEEALVRRTFQMCEALLRQATSSQAAAYDPDVVTRHMGTTVELARALHQLKGE